MRSPFVVSAAAALAILACGCARHQDPKALADATTIGVYEGDYAKTTLYFDDALKAEVTRASIGQISDQMHTLGMYHGLKPASSDPDRGRYDYEASFDKGTLIVSMRIDPTQKIGAYRVVPQGTPAASR
jgi:hypothetical protein